MNDCEAIGALVGPYIDEDLPQEARRQVERHLLRCPGCAWEAQTLRLTRERLREGVGETIASDAFRSRVLRRLLLDNPHIGTETGMEEPAPEQYRLPIRF